MTTGDGTLVGAESWGFDGTTFQQIATDALTSGTVPDGYEYLSARDAAQWNRLVFLEFSSVVPARRIGIVLSPGGASQMPDGAACSDADGTLPVGTTLERDYFGLGRLDWTGAAEDPGGIEFNMEISSWMRLFSDVGFDVADYHEIQAPPSADDTRFWVPATWARRFPAEQAWELVKR